MTFLALSVLGGGLQGCILGGDINAPRDGIIVVKVTTTLVVTSLPRASGPMPADPFTAYVEEEDYSRRNELPVEPNGSAEFPNLGIGFRLLAGVTNLPDNCEGAGAVPVTLEKSEIREVRIGVTCYLVVNTGTLLVSPEGLPVGTVPQIRVSGPSLADVALTAAGTTTFPDLTPGDYTISAQPTSVGGRTYTPTEEVQTVSVIRGMIATANVRHVLLPGSLSIQVTGLPDGLGADVTVTGPAGFSEALTASAVFTDLIPGTYTVSARWVVDPDGITTWLPNALSRTVEVTSGETATAAVAYSTDVETGQLDVSLSGVPPEADADVTVLRPTGESTHLTDGALLTDLPPGVYTIQAAAVEHGGMTLEPEVPSRDVTVTSGETAFVEVPYLTVTGNLLVDPGFEEGLHYVGSPVIPNEIGYWHGDLGAVSGAEKGIAPAEGSAMLRCEATGPFGAGAGSTGCEVYQALDLSAFAAVIDAGTASVSADALFNRVAGDAETDRRFTVDVFAFTGAPSTIRTSISTQGWVARQLLNLETDSDTATWETQRVILELPAGTRTVLLRLVADENVRDDAVAPEFDGHYLDDARLVLRYRQ